MWKSNSGIGYEADSLNKPLSKTTFLRLNKPADFRLVDEILNEICAQNTRTGDDSEELCIPESNAVQSLKCESVDKDIVEKDITQDTDVADSLTHPSQSGGTKLKFTYTAQYDNPAEFAAILGQVWTHDMPQEGQQKECTSHSHSVFLPATGVRRATTVIDRTPLHNTESIETEQMRRLMDIAAWRRSLLRDI